MFWRRVTSETIVTVNVARAILRPLIYTLLYLHQHAY